MEVLNILSNQTAIFSILFIMLFINFGCIIFLVLKEKQDDQLEINDLLENNEDRLIKNKIEELEEIEAVQDKQLEENKREVEEMLMKMQKDLEATPEEVVNTFENEQEEKSIISYQELLDSVNKKQEIKTTPIKIEEEKIDIEENEEKEFKGTEFISPIFGRMDNKKHYSTITKEEKDVDVSRKNDDFLQALKDFRKSLD